MQNAGFDTSAPTRTPQPASVAAVIGGFDRATDGPQGKVERGSGPGATVPVGFSASEAPPSPPPRRSATVRDAGFDLGPPAPPVGAPRRADPISVPVEVTFKPTPSYTDEARALKLEGEVLVEVEFAASGQIRVLRVVRGLGHGLDESAVHAAEQIRFRPAQSGGRAVDVHAIVHIVFRLA